MKKILYFIALILSIPAISWAGTTLFVGGGGTGATSFSPNSFIVSGKTGLTTLSATSTSPIYIGYLSASSTATSTLAGGLNVTSGCLAISGTCVGGGGGGTITGSGAAGLLTAWTSSSAITATSSPTLGYLTATSTSATSTFAGGVNIGNGANVYDFSSGINTVDNIQTGLMTFPPSSGVVSWVDMTFSTSTASTTIESYTANLAGNPAITVYGLTNAVGQVGTSTLGVGIGTTTPTTILQVGTNATTTVSIMSSSGNKGGRIILHDITGTACTEVTAKTGVLTAKVVTCP